MQSLTCPNCDAPIASNNINTDRQVAVCSECDTVFQFGEPAEKTKRDSSNNKPQKYYQPETVQITAIPDGFEIQRKWRSNNLGGLTFGVIFWDAFMVMWYTISIVNGVWLMALFGTLHALVGVALTYFLVAAYTNTTRMRVTHHELEVVTAPIYFHPPRTFDPAHIEQIFVKETGSQNSQPVFDLVARIYGEPERVISGNFTTYAEARFLEQELEDFLGIEDRPAAGEYTTYY